MHTVIKILGGAFVLTGLLFIASVLPTGGRSFGQIENIHGIPFPERTLPSDEPFNAAFINPIVITEELAHADLFLREPVLGKRLFLIIEFKPGNLKSLSVGVREDSFWLSYSQRQTIFPSNKFSKRNLQETYHGVVEIPLTDKLQETDRSVDAMFFAEADGEPQWELYNLHADVFREWPIYTYSYANFKNYVRSIVKRERAL